MKKTASFRIACITCLVLFMAITPASADGVSHIADYLSQKGQRLYERGDYKGAVHEFSKALLLDPNQSVALKYLKEFNLEGGIYGKEESPLAQISELSGDVVELKDKVIRLNEDNLTKEQIVKKLNSQNDELCDVVEQKKAEVATWQIKHNIVENELALQDSRIQGLKKGYKEKVVETRKLAKKIDRYRSEVKARDKIITIKDEDIGYLKDRTNIIKMKAYKEQMEYKDRIDDLKSDLAANCLTIDLLHDTLFKMKERLSENLSVTEERELQLSNAKDNLWVQAQKHEEEMAAKDYEVFETRKVMDNVVSDREDQLVDIDEKLQEKEEDITELKGVVNEQEMRLAKLQNELDDFPLTQPDTQANMQILEKDVLLEKKDESIAFLQEELARLRQLVTFLEENVKATREKEVAFLQQQMDDLKKQLAMKDAALDENEEAMGILESRLRDAQEQLAVVKEIIEEKDQQIRELEAQLDSIQSVQ